MKNYALLIQQEFYKIRKTLAFRSSWILPLLINLLIVSIFLIKAEDILKSPTPNMWHRYLEFSMGIMGSLILPMYVVFLTFSINDIEHKADTWKNLFSYPVEKRQVFLSKWLSAVSVFGIFMLSFFCFTYIGGTVLGKLNPLFGFQNHDMGFLILQAYAKMFLASLALLSLQFFFSMLWSDFMKSMGIGLLLTIASLIAVRWEYIYLSPYAQPMYSIMGLFKNENGGLLDFATKEIGVGVATAATFMILSYQMMKKLSIR